MKLIDKAKHRVHTNKEKFPTAPDWFAQVLATEASILKRFKKHLPTQAKNHNEEARSSNTTDFAYNEDLNLFAAERMVPGQNYSLYMVQHVARYLWAMSLCQGKTVVDLGCGDGYGTQMLSWVSETAEGIDLSREAVRESIRSYGSKQSLDVLSLKQKALCFSGTEIKALHNSLPDNPTAPVFKVADFSRPAELPNAEFGVCFEVLEHLEHPEELLQSISSSILKRVPFSVPNPLAGGSHINPHHINDWSLREVKDLFRDSRGSVTSYHQGLKRYQVKRGAAYYHLNWLFDVEFK